jgi:Ser/Thr protein kinase RdoA (MazF antagonist)
LSYALSSAEKEAVTRLFHRVQKEYEAALDLPVPWLLCRGDVRAANTLVTQEDQAWFTDFSSAHYAPALLDLVMPRFQWLMGEGAESRFLSTSEVRSMLRGYQSERPLVAAELAVFPAFWAAFYTERLTFLHTKWEPESPNRLLWPVQERILGLLTQALEIGQELIQAVAGAEKFVDP